MRGTAGPRAETVSRSERSAAQGGPTGRLPRRTVRTTIAGAVLVVLVLFGFTASPGVRSMAGLVLVLSVFSVAYGVLLGFANQPSLGQSLFFGLGAYSVILPVIRADWGFWQTIGLAFVLGLASGLAVGAIAVRLSEAYHVIVTALFASVAQLAANNFTPITGGEGGLSTRIPPVTLGPVDASVYDPVQNYLVALGFAAASFLVFSVLVRSPIGNVWQAIRENEERAMSTGYNVYGYKLLAFTICGGFTALSGALYAVHLRYASTEFFGLSWSVVPFLWVLIGGIGTLAGPIIGVAVFTVFQFYVSQLWTHYLILFGVVMIAVLRWAPQGIMGSLLQIRRPGWRPGGLVGKLRGRRSADVEEGEIRERV